MPVSNVNLCFFSGLLIALGVGAATPAFADSYKTGWYRELQVSVATDDNVSHAWLAPDRKPDTISTLSLGLGHSGMIGDTGKLILSGYLQYSNYARTAGVSSLSTSLGMRYIFQVTPGFHHAWYDTSLGITHLRTRGSTGRDGYILETRASVDRRLSGRLTARLGYGFQDLLFHDASAAKSAPFDVSRHEIFVGADYSLASRAWLYADYTIAHGTFTSSASGKRLPTSWGYDASARDPAFEKCADGNCTVWWAYRYKGNMNVARFGFAFTLHGVDYDFSGRYVNVRGDAGRNYRISSVLLGAAWDF